MRSLWFITPAWRRLEISAACFDQRAWACDELRKHGVDANVCVIADDGNLELALDRGFATVKRPNTAIGMRFNVGYEFAAASGIDYVCPIGSDSWVDPGFILDGIQQTSPDERTVIYSRHYAVIRPDGQRRAQLLVRYDGGTTMFYPTQVFASCGWKPIDPRAKRGCDGQTINAIKRGGPTRFRVVERHKLETVSFQSELQVTNYDALYQRWGTGETRHAFRGLDRHYPAELVDRMRAMYARGPIQP